LKIDADFFSTPKQWWFHNFIPLDAFKREGRIARRKEQKCALREAPKKKTEEEYLFGGMNL
jgi:hypothetical protein